MNNRQKAAIRQIEDAMKSAENAGIAFAGIDTRLVAFSKKQFYEIGKGRSPGEIINKLDYVSVACDYIDSCAT